MRTPLVLSALISVYGVGCTRPLEHSARFIDATDSVQASGQTTSAPLAALDITRFPTASDAQNHSELLVKSVLDPVMQQGYISEQSVRIGNAIASKKNALEHSCVSGNFKNDPKSNERYVMEVAINDKGGSIRLISMGILQSQSIEGVRVKKPFRKMSKTNFERVCGENYIRSLQLGGQLVFDLTLEAIDSNHKLQKELVLRIDENSAEGARRKMTPVLEQILQFYRIAAQRYFLSDPRPAKASLMHETAHTDISIDRMIEYSAALLKSPQEDLLQLQPLFLTIEKY